MAAGVPHSSSVNDVDSTGFAFRIALLREYGFILLVVFGGCCGNAWSLETLLLRDPAIGIALSSIQFTYISLQLLPSFLTFQPSTPGNPPSRIPHLKPRAIPLTQWTLQVLILASTSILNNWAFAYRVPLSVQILFRSAGLAISMLYGRSWFRTKYSLTQIIAVIMVTSGVIVATLSRPSTTSTPLQPDANHAYGLGILCLTVSLVLTGILGILQQQAYTRYGSHWREGVFYTSLLTLPFYAPFYREIRLGFNILASTTSHKLLGIPALYLHVILNVLSQQVCVSGVNLLTSRVSSVSTNLVLTARKALSLCVSVWLFGSGWNTRFGIGAVLVFSGTTLYASTTAKRPLVKTKTS